MQDKNLSPKQWASTHASAVKPVNRLEETFNTVT